MAVNLLSSKDSESKPSNTRMVPAIKVAIQMEDMDTLRELRALYPDTYRSSFKYLPKSHKQFLESTRLI